MTWNSDLNAQALPEKRRGVYALCFATLMLVPVIAALGIVLMTAVATDPFSEEPETTSFFTRRDSVDETAGDLPDSLLSVYRRMSGVSTHFMTEEAFLTAILSTSSDDAPALWIDLHDSLATVSVQGVPVRAGRIVDHSKSVLFDRLRSSQRGFDSLATPFRLVSATANITRIPIRHVQAPKDTSEARLRAPEAFVADEGNVHARLQFDRNVIIDLVPASTGRTSPEAIMWSLANRIREAVALVRQVILSEHRPAPMRIQLEMDSADIRAIFRAMPDGAGLAIRW